MSIATQISRLIGLRNRLRTKLTALGLVSSRNPDLEDCTDAVESITGTQAITDASVQYDVAGKQYAQVSDNNLVPSNIVSGVTILGVVGTGTGSGGTANLTTGWLAYGGVNAPSALLPPSGYDGFSRVNVELTDANPVLTSGNIRSGVTIMGVTGTYETTTETAAPTLADLVSDGITSNSVAITPTTSGRHLSQVTIPRITSAIDSNIIASNIKSGVTILGVAGSYQTPTQTKSMTLGASAPSSVTPDSGYHLSSVAPNIDTSVIKGENIRHGVNILGVQGTYYSSYINEGGTEYISNDGTSTTCRFYGITEIPAACAMFATTSDDLSDGKIINVHKCDRYSSGHYIVNYIDNGEIVGYDLTANNAISMYISNNRLVVVVTHSKASFADQHYELIGVS